MLYLGINFAKHVQDLYPENHKVLPKEIKDLNSLRDVLCSWFGRLSIVKMSVLSNLIYTFNKIPIKIPADYFVKLKS